MVEEKYDCEHPPGKVEITEPSNPDAELRSKPPEYWTVTGRCTSCNTLVEIDYKFLSISGGE